MFKYVLVAALVAVASANYIDVTPCPGQPEARSLNIPECTSSPCVVEVGQTLTLIIGVDIAEQTTSMPVSVIVTSGGREFPFDLPSGDACAAVPNGCPLSAGSIASVVFPVTIAGVNPGDETNVRVHINNQNGNTVACGSINTTFA